MNALVPQASKKILSLCAMQDVIPAVNAYAMESMHVDIILEVYILSSQKAEAKQREDRE